MGSDREAPRRSPSTASARDSKDSDPEKPRRSYLAPAVRLRHVSEVLERAATRPKISLDELAEMFGVSPGHLLRLFRDSGFMSPMRQVRRLRLQQVVEGLLAKQETMETLASRFGYSDGSSLRRALRRASEPSPRASKANPPKRTPDES